MLEALLGNATAEKVLLYIENYGEGYAQEIANTFNISLNLVQCQLQRLEIGGILSSVKKGNTRIFQWNPRCAFKDELTALFRKELSFLSNEDQEKYFRRRNRPRRSGKP